MPKRQRKGRRLGVSLKERMYKTQKGRCHYCKRRMTHPRCKTQSPTQATVDHQWPSSRGGYDRLFNKVLACSACNNRKGDRTAQEFIALINAEAAIDNPLW